MSFSRRSFLTFFGASVVCGAAGGAAVTALLQKSVSRYGLTQGRFSTLMSVSQGSVDDGYIEHPSTLSIVYKPSISSLDSYTPTFIPGYIYVHGYGDAGDGGAALYRYSVNQPRGPAKFKIKQSMGGTLWYELIEKKVTPQMFGWFGNTIDHSTQAQNMLDYFGTGDAYIDFYIPGRYVAKSLIWNGPGHLMMKGTKATFLEVADTSSDLLNCFSEGGCNISGFSVWHPEFDASIDGVFFRFMNGACHLDRMSYKHGFDWAIWSSKCINSGSTDCDGLAPKRNGYKVDVSPDKPPLRIYGILSFKELKFQATTNNIGTGILLVSGDTIIADDGNIAGFYEDIAVRPNGDRGYIANIFATNFFSDGAGGASSTQPGWFLDGTAENMIFRVELTNCWASSIGNTGIFVRYVKTLVLSKVIAVDNAHHGIYLENCRDVIIDGITASGNSAIVPKKYDGISIGPGCVHLNIVNNRSGPSYTGVDPKVHADTQRCGLFVSNDTVDQYTVSNNDFTGNLSGSLYDPNTPSATRLYSANRTGTAAPF